MSKCLILGANGCLGSYLVDELINKHETIRAFDRFNATPHKFFSHKNIEIVSGDFLNRNDIRQALNGIDYVFHFISTTTPATAENDPIIDIETNVKMSVQLFEECVNQKIKKVIYASTGGAIYGEMNNEQPISETAVPHPISPYAIGKLSVEHYLRYFKKKYGLDSVSFRISNAYGERHTLTGNQGVIPIFLQQIIRGDPITVLGDGSMVRDYIYAKDVARLISLAYKHSQHPIYNLGSGIGSSINEIINEIETLVQKPIKICTITKPSTFIEKVVLDTSLYTNEFNEVPEVGLREGIKKTWEYIMRNSV